MSNFMNAIDAISLRPASESTLGTSLFFAVESLHSGITDTENNVVICLSTYG